MAEKPRESLNDALSSYLADQATRPTWAEPTPRDAARNTGSNPDLGAAYQAIVETYRPVSRPVEAGPTDVPQGPPAPVSGKEQLLEASDRLVEHEATKPRFLGPVTAKWRRFVLPMIAAAATVGMAYLWIAKPEWLYPRFEAVGPPATELGAEQLLIAALIMVQQFEADNGRLPTTLNELGVDMSSVSMVVTGGGGYQLVTGVGGKAISLRVLPGVDPRIEGGTQ